ncbi:cellulose binding domain-containing protein [Hymenobacter sp. GOD-10R]|uniref:cellulose binding domain-containing protein n=1 Tax=Hymenobacter sp. GOD-10R TaxID=3093922 RepID=UPI002D7860EE|nr:cellulose binding domain-containing protein [Hymenobacter sp. GOD-10R]WRQ26727.1 cellulose binding domain-containing protein [Hymenobacter sp. GOD-10R]
MTRFYKTAWKLGQLPAFIACFFFFSTQLSWGQTVPYPLAGGTYKEDFEQIGTVSGSSSAGWTTTGWAFNFASGVGANRFSVATATAPATLPNSTTVFATSTSGGVQKGTATSGGVGTIALLATGSTDGTSAAAFDLNLDFTASTAGSISLNWAEVSNSTGNRAATFKLQTNTGDNGAFIDLDGSTVVITNNVAANGSLTTIPLPAAFAGKKDAKIRFYLVNTGGGTTGSRPKISLDNITVATSPTGTPTPTTSITTTASAFNSPYCVTADAGSASFNVAYTTTGTLTGTFKAQLSNATGSFASGTTIIGEGASSPIAATIPANTASGTSYRVRVINEAAAINGTDNGTNLTINLGSTTNPVTVTPAEGQTITLTGSGATLTAKAATGSVFTWQYGISAGGPFTTLASASGATYQPKGSDFGAAGTYYVVANASATTACGTASGKSTPIAIIVTAPKPEILTSLTSMPAFGSTVAGAASTSKSFTVSGTGLTSALIVSPPAGFEIRTGEQPFSCCVIQLQPSNGTVNTTTIDVRFAPVAAQPYQATIPVTSPGLPDQAVAVSGTSTTPVYPATVNTTDLFDITSTGAKTGGTIEPDGGSPVTARGVVWAKTPNPVLNTLKTADGAGAGTFTSAITGLVPGTTYYARAYATNGAGTAYGQEFSFTTVEVPLATEPTQSATPVASQVTSTSIQLILNGGDGAKHLVLARLNGAVNALPVDATTYADSTVFGKGAVLGTDNYVVYAGTRDTVVVTNLRPNTSYSFAVFDYSDNNTLYAENYLATSPGTLVETTVALPAAMLLEENFDYTAGTLLTANNWTSHSGTSNFIPVTSSGLEYASYGASKIGNAASLTTTGQDVNRQFPAVYARTPVYASFLVNVSAAKVNVDGEGDYFFHLGPTTLNGNFKARVFARKNPVTGKLQFGISGNGTSGATPNYTTNDYEYNTTYLVVVNYSFDENGNVSKLFINPALDAEPVNADAAYTETSGSPSDIGTVALRQGTTAIAPTLVIDGIRVGNSYRVVRTGLVCLPPQPAFTANTACVGQPTAFTNTSKVVEANATYAWDVDNDGTVDYTTKNISHTYAEAGTYTAKLTITQGQCSDSYTQQVTVRALPTVALSGTSTICAGSSTNLTLHLTGTAPWTVKYSADGGATATALTINAADVSSTGDYQLAVSPTVTSTYTLLSVVDSNCDGLAPTGSATVTVNTKPVLTLPTISATNATAGLRGASVAFVATATGSTPAPSLAYSIVKNGVTTAIASPYVFPLGATTVTATATNDCGSTSGTFVVTVQTPTVVTVLHQNADGQVANNAIKPNLQLVNNSSAAIAYKDLTVRYWLTVEDYASMVAAIDYAQLGTSGVKARYVALDQPAQGAFGYVEYSFTAAGALPAGGNSGAIQSRIYKQTQTNFNEADDYSYAANTTYLKNERITVYRNGELIAGVEPALLTMPATPKLVVLSANKEKKTTANTISTYLQVRNDGTAPVAYKDLTVRYWLSPEGTQQLNSYIDYAQLGTNNVTVSFGKAGTETYAELHFAGTLGTFTPLSSTGNVQYRVAKSDWSNFNQANDFSYLAFSDVLAENPHITAYVNGTLVYGQEPTGARSTAAVLGTQSAEGAKAVVSSYPNPFTGSTTIAFTAAQSKNYQLEIYDISGRLVKKLQSGKAQAGQLVEVEWQAGDTPTGLYLARLTTGTTVQQVKLVLQ